MNRGSIRALAAKLISRPMVLAAIVAVIATLLAILAYTLSNRRSTESLREYVEQQKFVFLVPARGGLLPGDVIQWPEVVPGSAPSGDPELFERSAEVLGFTDEGKFERTGPYDVTLQGSVDAGLRAGALSPDVAAQAKARGAETFELVMKDVVILEVPVAALQRAIGANPALLQALRNPNRTVVSRVLRPGRFHYRFGASGSTGFAASLKRLFGGEGEPEVEGGGTFNSMMEVKSDFPLVIGFAMARLDLSEARSSASASPVRALNFEESRSLQTDANAALWPVGSTIRVGFMERSPEQEALFKEAMGEWLKYTNLKVSYVESGMADIRVKFSSDFQGWSYVGTGALRVDRDEPTIILGYPVDHPSARSSFLHEIGHALGLVHEFQNPQAEQLWNREAVYAHFGRSPQNWPRATIDRMFFDTGGYPGSRAVDFRSVMSYPLPPQLFRSRQSFSPGNDLSQSDRAYIAQLYPREET